MEKLHIPVLLSEVLANLEPKLNDTYLDLTAGYGGHARSILDVTRNYKDSYLIDRDEFAVNYLENNFKQIPTDHIINTDFYSAVLQFIECGKSFDIILADFGVSSPQLDMEARGFSFKNDGPLDMRMDRRQQVTAADIVNKYSEKQLAELFIKYGEEQKGRAVMFAKVIVHHRPFKTTRELAEIIRVRIHGYSKIHPATKVFQAIRIAVNDELGQIEKLSRFCRNC